jgi:Ca-activated chloride channel family protein
MVWHSGFFFLLLIPLAALGVWLYLKRNSRKAFMQISSHWILKDVERGLRVKLKHLPALLSAVALILAIVALARPQKADTRVVRNVDGIDIVVVLDISDSMLIEDMVPENRLEAAKKIISDFVNQRISDRIGLVVFAGESYTRVPLTLDYPLLLQSIKEVRITRNIKMGTAIGVALANGVARLKDSKAKSRVLILLTDGENNSGTIAPETALKIAKDNKIRIYTVGIGKDGQAQLPIYSTDMFGRKTKRYQPMYSAVNVDLLTRLASETGGKFYRVDDTEQFEAAFEEINKLEKTKVEVQQYTMYSELFPPWVAWTFWLYFFAVVSSATWLRRGP